ncbi:hypothetical protein [Nostoc sp. NMS1]|uniref:hypothetical protein n=1 Tax=Nostoc sp. NMS1 TaxID=2815388 RepID=UPI0025F8A5C9|nr:hypothetical protein [Nostoc sp. NMS1]
MVLIFESIKWHTSIVETCKISNHEIVKISLMRFKKNLQLIVTCFLSSTILFKVILVQFSAIALELDGRNNITLNAENKKDITNKSSQNEALLIQTLKNANSNLRKNEQLSKLKPIELIAENNVNLSPKSLLNSDKVDNLQSKALLKETNSDLQKTKQLSEFTIADVIPIEEYKVEPPKPQDEGEEQTKPNTTKPNTNIPTQQILIEKLRRSKKQQQAKQKEIILDALTFSANKYPWIVNPTDNLTFSTELFKPNENENYIDTDISVRFSGENQIINKFTYAKFPKADQFYWVLDNNRIVVETKGSQVGILSQGRQTNTYITQNVTSQQAFWGLQTLFAIPTDFRELSGEVDTSNFSVTSIAGQLVNPEGIPAGRVIINSGIDSNNPNVTVLKNPIPVLGSGSTLSIDGGQALFQALDATNAPKILQGFPTTNIQPLLDDGNVRLQIGEIIPNSALEAAGISWGNILTGEGFGFTAPVSSFPGIKVAQLGKFDNFDLLNVAVNPFLSQSEKDFHYLNSLQWLSLGRRDPVFETLSQSQESSDWHRLYVSHPHNRSLIQYDPVAIKATYSNIFSAPGLSLTAKFSDTSIDAIQSVNSTLGLLLGGVFEAIKIDNIQQSLEEARQKLKNGEGFVPLNTPATAEQRRQINNRLNRTLSYANASSGLEQVSGTYTFPSQVTPKNSSILQIRIGNHKRAVQFLERNISILDEGDTFFSDLRLSNEKFGPLTYIGIPIPLNGTSIDPINESSAVEVILTNPQGQRFVQKFNSADSTLVPLQVRAADLAFDYMELTRVDKIGVSFNNFNGYLSLPTVELLSAGSSGNFNYSANVGTWFNIDANSAPGVSNNNLGTEEPTLGFYTNILLNYIKTDIRLNSAKKPVAINTHVPYLRVDWNSASNRNNPFSTYLSYLYQHQERNFGFSLAPGIAFIENNSNGEFLGLFNGEFSTSHGLNIKTNLEMGKEVFFEFQGLHRVSKNISAGVYLKNYSINNLGLSSRVSGFNYGVIMRHNFPDNSVFIETQIGTGENGFDLKLQGGYRF